MNKISSLIERIRKRHSAGCNLYLNDIGHPLASGKQNVCSCGAFEDADMVEGLELDAASGLHAKSYYEFVTIPDLQKRVQLLEDAVKACEKRDWVDLYMMEAGDGEIDLVVGCNDYFIPAADAELVPRNRWREVIALANDETIPSKLFQWVADQRGIPNVSWKTAEYVKKVKENV